MGHASPEGDGCQPDPEGAHRASAAWAVHGPRGGRALSTASASAIPMAASVAGIAARSIADGRHGIITRSASRAASAAPPASRGAVSITTRDAPASAAASTTRASLGGCAAITTGGTPSRSRPHTVADPCGSRSITAACPPTSSWAAARARARVVFPASALLRYQRQRS